ncbi:MAG: hypothetical protein HOD13_08190 [Rhodospirillaceae bacterium]|nr:hypothetical protein [Rhodospirillaceae bacterium]MBT6306377.1 hypothetical protein [Rhodospirillaceae bacterium]MDC0998887.1 hypothetical protein [Alphaproteobacteria bacterium]
MSDSNLVDPDIKQGLRILADSTKLKGTEGVARRLSKAADSGMIEDYNQAETIFDSLPLEKRATIKTTAESKAETIRLTNQKRQSVSSNIVEEKQTSGAEGGWDLGDPNSDEGIFSNNGLSANKSTTATENGLDTKNELDALKEEMQQALKG